MKNNAVAVNNEKKISMKMDFSQMIITIGAIVIGLLFVSLAFILYNRMSTTMNKAGQKLDAQNTMLDESAYTDYDGAIISGTELVSFIKTHANDQICITVNNGHTTTSYVYDSTDLSTKSTNSIVEAQNKANISTVYINPNSKYQGKIVRDDADSVNGTIVGVEFTIYSK